MNKNNVNEGKQNKLRTWMIRWYEYNKYKIPVIFTLIGSLLFTLFLDFRTDGFTFKSHLASIQLVTSNIIGFYLFAIYLISMVQLFNSISFSRKRSPVSFFLFIILNIIQALLVYSYTVIFFQEAAARPDYTIPQFTYMSIGIMIAGIVFYAIASIFATCYVNWKYVKIEE